MCALAWTITRDSHLIKLKTGDIRNRVVGARLQKDNQSPYFYKWKTGDSIRYYDPANFYPYAVSPATASPFFHILLYPIADFEQRTINWIWLVLQYLLLAVSVFLCLGLARTIPQKTAVMIAGIGILFTEGWINMIVLGQLYLIPPFLAIVFVYFFRNKKSYINAFISGLIFIIAVLIRPTILFFFLPFILLSKKYGRGYKILFAIPSVLLLAWIFTSNTQRQLWKDYRRNIDEQVKVHYAGNPTLTVSEPDPHYTKWEGLDYDEMTREAKKGWFINKSQHVNFFYLAFDVFHIRLSLQMLVSLFFIAAIVMFIVFAFVQRGDRSFYNFPLLGCALYMLCDFFSPIDRYQYYAVQWLCPLLIAAIIFTFRFWKTYFLITICLVLNIVNVGFIKMEHTIGEYLWLLCFFYLAVFYKQKALETGYGQLSSRS